MLESKENMKMKTPVLLGMGAALMATSCSGNKQQTKTEAPQTPNVVFIVADDIGYGDLSCNGSTTIHTPNVEKLAQRGVLLTNAHAAAATSTPSRYSLFTGHYAWRRDDTGIAPGDAGMVIRPEQPTVADMFRECGYATGAIGKWHLGLGDKTGTQDWNGFITPGPQDIGFDYSYLMAATADRVPCVFVENQRIVNLDPNDPVAVSYTTPFPGEPLGKDHPEMLTKLKPSHGHDMAIVNGISRIGYMKGGKQALWHDEDIADSITTKAVQFIDQHKDNPFFLYVGTNDVHVPRWPNSRFVGKSGMGVRGDAILQFDWTVGEILDALDRAGLTDNTLVVLTSDNGPVVDDGYADQAVELLGEHKPWGPFRGGKYSIFEAGTRVPMIVSWPAKVQPKVSDALVSLVDLYASMAALMGKELKPGEGPDSQNYLDAFLGNDPKGRDYVVEAAGTLSVSDGEWKYIAPSNGSPYNAQTNIELGNSKEEQLYNLKDDVNEQNNLIASHPDIAARLKAILETEKAK
jgi:arylsulfatase A-like enzyme